MARARAFFKEIMYTHMHHVFLNRALGVYLLPELWPMQPLNNASLKTRLPLIKLLSVWNPANYSHQSIIHYVTINPTFYCSMEACLDLQNTYGNVCIV